MGSLHIPPLVLLPRGAGAPGSRPWLPGGVLSPELRPGSLAGRRLGGVGEGHCGEGPGGGGAEAQVARGRASPPVARRRSEEGLLRGPAMVLPRIHQGSEGSPENGAGCGEVAVQFPPEAAD